MTVITDKYGNSDNVIGFECTRCPVLDTCEVSQLLFKIDRHGYHNTVLLFFGM